MVSNIVNAEQPKLGKAGRFTPWAPPAEDSNGPHGVTRPAYPFTIYRNFFVAVLALMPFGNSQKEVPEGQMKIAQRFNAGAHATRARVPKGRLNGHPSALCFSRPCGTRIGPTTFPALKRRAIIEMSLRDKLASNFRKALVCGIW